MVDAALDHRTPDRTAPDRTVVVCEDDASVLAITDRMLREIGFDVFATADPEEALQFAEGRTPRIGLLVTDVVMPRMDGDRLAARLRRNNPDLAVLFVSGYRGRSAAELCRAAERTAFLEKPYGFHDLLSRIRGLFDLDGEVGGDSR